MVNNCSHRVETITATDTNLVLTVSDSTNISPYERFDFYFPDFKTIRSVITGAPLPVLISVNGTNVTVYNKNFEILESDEIPRRSMGRYIVPETGTPYIVLYNTPQECNCKGNCTNCRYRIGG